MDIAHHHMETLERKAISRETGETMKRQSWRVLEGQHLTEVCIKQAFMETTFRDLCSTTGHYAAAQ